MPHDRNGQEVQVGDLVSFTGRVTSVSEGAISCNLGLEAVHKTEQHEKDNIYTGLTVTASLCEKHANPVVTESEPAPTPEAAPAECPF